MFDQINIKWLSIISLLIILLSSIYRYLSRNFDYWKSRGIKGPKPFIVFGSLEIFYKPFKDVFADQYKKYGRLYGTFVGDKPVLIVNEPNLIKDIFIKDFHIFVNRNDLLSGDPINDRSLLNAHGDDWKQLRSVISPTFSSGKMRRMHPLIEDCVKRAETVLENAAKNKQEIELKKLMGNLTMDVIATCAFATKIDTHNDPNNAFIKNAEKFFGANFRIIINILIAFTFPKLAKKLKLSFLGDKAAQDFFTAAIRSIIQRRENDNMKNVDFLQLMINAQKKLNLEEIEEKAVEVNSIFDQSENTKYDKTLPKLEITETEILATAFLFFVAGYETTATLISFLSYSLALEQDCQQKLYDELKSVDKLDYDTIAKLPYLDACIAETQRLYNSLGALSRIATQDYKLGDTDITIPKGMMVQINVEGIHHDPEYYPNPTHFDPERFMPENRDKLVPYTLLPFGIGPRNCVGMRFALMEAKTAIAHIITKFKFIRTANTEVPVKFKKFAILLSPENGLKVGVEKRNV